MATKKKNIRKVPDKALGNLPGFGPSVDLKKVAEKARELSRLLGKR